MSHSPTCADGSCFRRVVTYADDFVILSRGCAAEALSWTRNVMARIGLTLKEAKTSIKQARRERFDFLGYGTRLLAYRAVDHYVYGRVRSFIRRRHKVPSGGYTTFSDAIVFGKLGVLRLRDVHLARLP